MVQNHKGKRTEPTKQSETTRSLRYHISADKLSIQTELLPTFLSSYICSFLIMYPNTAYYVHIFI